MIRLTLRRMPLLLFLATTIVFATVTAITIYAQPPRGRVAWNWYFGYGAGLSFASDTPTLQMNSSMSAFEGSASISDRRSGRLLFYTDGRGIWDARHQQMPNAVLLGHESSTQTALIVPAPGNDSLYYVFTTGAGPYVPQPDNNGLRYSVVDMRMNGGWGAVDLAQRNIPLLTPSAEKITATRHCNGRDYWVIAHEWGTDAFYTYLVSDGGISQPVISNVGIVHTRDAADLNTSGNNCVGAMKTSPDGHRIAVAVSGLQQLEVYDFDPSSGVVSNPVNLSIAGNNVYYGVSFSPDNTKLYATTNEGTSKLIHYDLLAGDADAIRASAQTISISPRNLYGSIQLGPDRKLYVTTRNTGVIAVVNSPNDSASNCDVDPAGIIVPGNQTGQGLPNFIDCDVVGVNGLNLTITNDASVKRLLVGDMVTFTLRVCNNYGCDVSNIIVHDTLPPGFDYVDGVDNYPYHTFDLIPAGECRSLWLRARVRPDAVRQVPITDCATIIGSSPERGNDINDSACADVMVIEPVTPQADIGVLCTVDNSVPERGDPVRYQLAIYNQGPTPATTVVVRDLLPAGVSYGSYTIDKTGGTYDPVTGNIILQLLDAGDTATVAINCLVDISGAGAIENCAELVSVQPQDINTANDRSCITINPRWCNAPEVIARVHIPDNLSTGFDRDLAVPVILDDSLDATRVTRIRITFSYDSTIARLTHADDIAAMLRGTLLDGWHLVAIDSSRGHLTIELAAPTLADILSGTGTLAHPTIRMYLGERYTSSLALSVEFPDNPCAAAIATNGMARLDSLCGLQFRLFEVGEGVTKLRATVPNPFNPSTNVRFSIGLDSPVLLDIVNAQGEGVAMLLDEYLQPGEYAIQWNAGELPSGMYYSRLHIPGSRTQILPMLLVK